MKNRIKWYPVLLFACIAMIQCTKSDDYKKYLMEDGAAGLIVYPQKPDQLKTYPGRNRIQLEWVIIDPKVTQCVVTYEQAGNQDTLVIDIEERNDYTNDTIRVMINDLEENMYMFKIISYDDLGHASIPVEAEELSYGEVYESFLLNRTVKSMVYDTDQGLLIEWYPAADTSEICIVFNYTNNNGDPVTTTITNKQAAITHIPDFDYTVPVTYYTMYKPAYKALDIFYSSTTEKKVEYTPYYWAEITGDHLKNYEFPFAYTGSVYLTRYYPLVDWTFNNTFNVAADGGGYGHYDYNSARRGSMVISSWYNQNSGNTSRVLNGKLYQAVELEAGEYRFGVWVYETTDIVEGNAAYSVVADATDTSAGEVAIPDIDETLLTLVSQPLAYKTIPSGLKNPGSNLPSAPYTGIMLTHEFTLTAKSTVHLGMVAYFPVANPGGNANVMTAMYFSGFQLWEFRHD